ncbi:MAG: conjugal transfer protein TrbJ, partial [Nitrosomonas sp.]|nr:conjugal transfer protein TrbJ [Nitrosomonas sp.]
MTNSKNIVSQLIVILIILGNFGYSSVTKAGGMAVIDMANIKQTTTTAIENVAQTLKQIEQYQTQLQQYENMIRNT